MQIPSILLTFNDAYAPHAAVVMESIIRNASDKVSFIIMYFEDELSEDIREIFIKHYIDRVRSLSFSPVDVNYKNNFHHAQFSESLTVNTFLRLLASNILSCDYLVYLDCDLIVLDDIFKLFRFIDWNYAINAIPEHYPNISYDELQNIRATTAKELISIKQEKFQFERKKYLNMNADASYFNAGVISMNLDLCRKMDLLDNILSFIKNHPFLHSGDQDALNGVLNGCYNKLPLRWNVHPYIYNLDTITSKYSIDELKTAWNTPAIIHFAGYKAWQYRFEDEKIKEFYWEYRKMTPWTDKKEEGRTLRLVFLKKFVNPFKRWIKRLIGFKNIMRIKTLLK